MELKISRQVSSAPLYLIDGRMFGAHAYAEAQSMFKGTGEWWRG